MNDSISRRKLIALAGLASMLPVIGHASSDASAEHVGEMMAIPQDAPVIAMLVHPKMAALDLIGPMTVFRILRSRILLVWKDTTPVSTDLGFAIPPTDSFTQCPPDLDVLFVPGGILGSIDCMNDPTVMAFLADRGARAKWVTSVCTGGLTLAAAGLLKGYDATAHWAVADLLPLMGARHVDKRMVIDRNRMTGGGVTAGIDFGLALAAKLKGEEEARKVQLMIEYAPEPPFRNGTPVQAGPERVAAARKARTWMDQQARLAATMAGRRLGVIE